MKALLNKWFVAFCIIWLVVLLTRKLGHPLPYVNGYIDDAIAIPVIGGLALWFQRVVIIKNDFYVLSVWHVVFITAYVIILFEGLLPLVSKSYTADWRDALLYIIGAVFFYKIMNRAVTEIRNV
jgi:hypothetical protein